jgi:hypothetical protein
MPHFAYLSATLLFFALILAAPEPAFAGKTKNDHETTKSLTVYAAGDIADCRKKPAAETMAARTAELIQAGLEKDSKALVITLGDNTYPVGKPEEFSNCYDATWGQFKARTLPAPGNHDYGMPQALGYYNYFDDLAGPDRRGYYRKIVGNWQLISLNSNLDGQAMQEQLNWLKSELDLKKTTCTLAYWHHPVYASGGHGNNDVMQPAWKLLAVAKADLVLTAHDHDYERLVPLDANGEHDEQAGIRSFVVGTGGVALTAMFFPKAISAIRNNTTHGVLKLSLHAKSYDWEFLPVAGQSFSDKGHGKCH